MKLNNKMIVRMLKQIQMNNLLTDYGLDALSAVLHETAIEKGFWEGEYSYDKIGNKLALVHSEVTEVLEAIRKDQGSEKVVEEMADVLIRLLDLYAAMRNAGFLEHSLDEILDKKMEINTDTGNNKDTDADRNRDTDRNTNPDTDIDADKDKDTDTGDCISLRVLEWVATRCSKKNVVIKIDDKDYLLKLNAGIDQQNLYISAKHDLHIDLLKKKLMLH